MAILSKFSSNISKFLSILRNEFLFEADLSPEGIRHSGAFSPAGTVAHAVEMVVTGGCAAWVLGPLWT